MSSIPQAAQIIHPARLSREASDAIRVARVLCIMFMTTVHIWPGASRVLAADVGPALHTFYLIAIDYLGRGSVPLLSVVSGFLLTRSLGKTAPLDVIRGKAQALLVPMVIWSLAVLVLIVARAVFLGDGSDMPQGPMGWINAVFSVTAPPANIPVAFLRDVFISAVLGVALVEIARQMPPLALGLGVALIAVEVLSGGMLLLRPQILAFYMAGLFLGARVGRLPEPPWALVLMAVGLEVVLRHGMGLPSSGDGGTGLWMSYLGRIAMSLLMWRTALDIRRSEGGLWRLTRVLEPHIFVIFCSHMLTVLTVAFLGGHFGIVPEDRVYPLVFLGQFILIALVGLAISVMGRRYAPGLLAIASGKREG